MEQNNIIIIPDEHCRGLYKQVLDVKNTPIIFLGDYMDPYYREDTSNEQGIANLEEIIDFAKSNPNVTLLAGNHDSSYIWSFMGFERTSYKFYPELHKLYRDNINLFKPCLKINDVLFTHAGVSANWVNTIKKLYEFELTPDNITDYIGNEFEVALKEEQARGFRDRYLPSPIFDIGSIRGGYESCGGPFWNDIREYHDPIGWDIKQIFGHTQLEKTGNIFNVENGYCIDSRAVFEYNFDTNELKLWQKSEE